MAVALRKSLHVSLDDLLAVVREFLNPNVSRSGLDRCLRRHGVGNLRDLKAKTPRPKHSGFKAYEPGYIHIDVKYLPHMADQTSRRYLFVAIDRATRWVFIRIYNSKTAANALRFLRDLERACPIRIRTILTERAKSAIGPARTLVVEQDAVAGIGFFRDFIDGMHGVIPISFNPLRTSPHHILGPPRASQPWAMTTSKRARRCNL